MFQIRFKNSLVTLLCLAAFALFASAPAYSQEKVLVNQTQPPSPCRRWPGDYQGSPELF
jgi:hypothetical protein